MRKGLKRKIERMIERKMPYEITIYSFDTKKFNEGYRLGNEYKHIIDLKKIKSILAYCWDISFLDSDEKITEVQDIQTQNEYFKVIISRADFIEERFYLILNQTPKGE